MADALCGPVNPLQQFQKQSGLDRTLQQDRLTSRQSPSQGFRSADPNAGLLDPEFEAFQAGVPPSELAHLPSFQHTPPSFAGPSQAPAWAADFQRMQISPAPSFQQQPFAPPRSQAGHDWAQGFQQHIAQVAPRAPHSAPSPQAFQYRARYGTNGYQSQFAPPSFAPAILSKGKETAIEQFDDAAFERAFDQARDAMMVEPDSVDGVIPASIDRMPQEAPYVKGASTGNVDAEEMYRTGEVFRDPKDIDLFDFDSFTHDPIAGAMLREDVTTTHTADQTDDARQAHDDDALAMTAQELLEKVEHNTTDKFRNSQFLGLMRRLRDREVKVDGDKMVETDTSGEQLNASPKKSVHFDNSEQTPHPIDSTPVEYNQTNIPPSEQDHDAGRYINHSDGQEVVDLLDQPSDGPSTHDIGTSSSRPQSPFPEGVYYGDLRQRGWSEVEVQKTGGVLRPRPFETATGWDRWDAGSHVGLSRNKQPPPGMP